MGFATWLMLGAGIFLLYAAYKGQNPLAMLAEKFGIAHASPVKLSGGGLGGGGGGSW